MKIRTRISVAAALVLSVFAVAQYAKPVQPSPAPAAAENQKVQATIDNFVFTPTHLTVNAGTTVVWANKDDIPHTVTSDTGLFASSVLDTDQKFEYTFAKPGTFTFHCKLHPTMTGVVEVQ